MNFSWIEIYLIGSILIIVLVLNNLLIVQLMRLKIF